MMDPHAPMNLTWQVHLARQQPQRAAATAGIILLATLMVCAVMGNLFWALLVLVGLFGSLHDFFLPMRYALTERGVEAKGLVAHNLLEWERVQRFYVLDDGIKVSPLAGPSRLEAYRGVFLRCEGEMRKRVLDTVQMKLAERETA